MHQATPFVYPSPTATIRSSTAARRRSAPALYSVLAALFVIAVAYHLRAVEQYSREWFGANLVNWPFLLYSEDQPHFLIHYAWRQCARRRSTRRRPADRY